MIHVPYDSVPSIANFLIDSVLLALPEMLHTGACRRWQIAWIGRLESCSRHLVRILMVRPLRLAFLPAIVLLTETPVACLQRALFLPPPLVYPTLTVCSDLKSARL
jgi:hypothetical protein